MPGRTGLVFAALGIAALLIGASAVFAAHNGADVDIATTDCGETTFTAGIIDPAGTHKVANMRLVVHADGATQFTGVIPTNGDTVSITVGPFVGAGGTETISWRVFGGGERGYDSPLWNGFGGATFNADVNAYGTANGFGFVVAGPDDPNPFTNWHEFDVDGCVATPSSKDDCKNGGWQNVYRADGTPFKNQGDCVSHVASGGRR